MDNKKSAFSLVELSIVLVILGLLTGGVLAGKSLIHAAELRSISTEYTSYRTAIYGFQQKYFELPGDMPNATDFWGTSANCPGNTSQGTTDGSTCDGDGDGIIENTTQNSSTNEVYKAWQHLTNAGLVTGVYEGVTGPGHSHSHSVPNFNIPASKFSDAGWTLRDYDLNGGDSETYASALVGGNGNIFDFGAECSSNTTRCEVISPEDLWALDKKMDDGEPGRGIMVVRHVDNCTTDGDSSIIDTDYLLTETDDVCAIIFRNVTD